MLQLVARQMKSTPILLTALAMAAGATAHAQPPNLNSIASDITVPELSDGPPAAGRRVKQTNPGYEGWELFHTNYLPSDWTQPAAGERRWPVIVEYPGNGGYKNALGDVCTGKPEDCKLGYGLSDGRGFIWVALPFVDPAKKQVALNWWGDPDATAKYCVETVRHVCSELGGDPKAVVLTGFSRGAIACNYIGLRNDEIAALWCGMLPHSHYDGVRRWPYADSDELSAAARLKRLGSRPQFISHETSIDATRDYLKRQSSEGKFTFLAIPFPNHSDQWVLKDIPERKAAREWLMDVIKQAQRP